MRQIQIGVVVFTGLFSVEASAAVTSVTETSAVEGVAQMTKVEHCGEKPNCVSSSQYHVPEDDRKGWHIEPLGYENRNVDGQRAFKKLESVLTDAGLELEEQYPTITAVATTRLFGYKDDLHFVLDEEKGLVHIRSESRKGYYDFGKNRRRLEAIRDEFVLGQ